MTKKSNFGNALPEWVGETLSAETRSRWRALISLLNEMSAPGCPLEGWVFHGTTAEKADRILIDGMEPTDVMLNDGDDNWFAQGSFWGRPLVAAGYAEDIERIDTELDDPCALIAIRISDLAAECGLVIDEAALDFPEERLTGMTPETLAETWKSREVMKESCGLDWSDSFEILGSFAAVHNWMMPPECFFRLRNTADVEFLLYKHSRHESALTVRMSS